MTQNLTIKQGTPKREINLIEITQKLHSISILRKLQP